MFIFLCERFCIVLYAHRLLRQTEHCPKGVLIRVLIRQRNLQGEAAKVLTMTAEPLMMMLIMYIIVEDYFKVPGVRTIGVRIAVGPIQVQTRDC
jgi:hypothetical protein